MDETTRRTAVLGIGSVLLLGGCSDAVDSGDEDEGNGTDDGSETDDANGTDDTNGASGAESADNESDGDADVSDDEDVDDADEDETDDEYEATAEGMSSDEFVARVEDVYDGEVAAYDETETHGALTLVGDADASRLELAGDVQELLDVYSVYVEEGDPPAEQLAGTVESDDGGMIGSVTVQTEWVEAYNRGDMSRAELRDRVLETVET
ncbi:hypothetical protein [Natronococcus occultus]|uniref:DUF8159 domain-containing protein n=1 Tax=Natronococcus occultus SP4 TaxID=694430 RepID=L0K302_9EURY|nr:hypothetical protein [Natronococcus occultus]AGB38734.1 hypothetical protein Natoc_2979 [Natronococcus occultus SP4]